MEARGYNEESEWVYINDHENLMDNIVTVQCQDGVHLCAYFPVGYIPFLKYEKYDVLVSVDNHVDLRFMQDTELEFHAGYFSKDFLNYQLVFRTIFTLISVIVLLVYATGILCRVPPQLY